MFKLVVVSVLVALAVAQVPFRRVIAPTGLPLPVPVARAGYAGGEAGAAIVSLRNDAAPDSSSYDFAFETQNGIAVQESGALGPAGPEGPAIAATGSYQYTSPEGLPVQISYRADENGFQPIGNVLPTPPPIPEAILRSLEYNAAHPEQEGPIVGVAPGLRTYYRR
ncbi:hypothetical protein NQ315_004929 [Exocentrus adspersus]|uniref:Uncharacterized protein n=1 Tax=Exocentrus adspersus TaxID=1586481 RepID=A0AAV8W2S1_9CUCU|nr:hypothetical protein NQ315_004929 [Exocentrus adspersus]